MNFEHDGFMRRAAVYAPADWLRRHSATGVPLPVVFILPDGANGYAPNGTAEACARRTGFYPESTDINERYVNWVDAYGLPVYPGEPPYDDLFVAVFCEPLITQWVPLWHRESGSGSIVRNSNRGLDGTWTDHASYMAIAHDTDDVGYIRKVHDLLYERFEAIRPGALDPVRKYVVGEGSGGTMVFKLWQSVQDRRTPGFAQRMVIVNGTIGGYPRRLDHPERPRVWLPEPAPLAVTPDLLFLTGAQDDWLPLDEDSDGVSYSTTAYLGSAYRTLVQSSLQVFAWQQLGLGGTGASDDRAPLHVTPRSSLQAWRDAYHPGVSSTTRPWTPFGAPAFPGWPPGSTPSFELDRWETASGGDTLTTIHLNDLNGIHAYDSMYTRIIWEFFKNPLSIA